MHSNGECQAHYRANRKPVRARQKPGPKPDSSKPFSRHGGELSHHGKRVKCKAGHEFDGVDANGKQTCSICAERKPCPAGHAASFKNARGACKECARLAQPARARAYKYGITPARLEEMLEEQDYCCALCHKPLVLEGKYPFAVDHDHSCCPGQKTCGKCIRGILHHGCNKDLREDIDWHRSAIDYLEIYTSKN